MEFKVLVYRTFPGSVKILARPHGSGVTAD
jgi:hypothetical protein